MTVYGCKRLHALLLEIFSSCWMGRQNIPRAWVHAAAIFVDSGTIYTNPASESSCESDTISSTSFVPVWESSSILEEQCTKSRSWCRQVELATGDETSHRPTDQDNFLPEPQSTVATNAVATAAINYAETAD